MFGEKKVQFPNYVQLYLTTVIFDEKRAFSVDKTELLSYHETRPSELFFCFGVKKFVNVTKENPKLIKI